MSMDDEARAREIAGPCLCNQMCNVSENAACCTRCAQASRIEIALLTLLTERDAAREEMVRLRRGDLTRAEIEELLETDPERVGKGMAVQLRLPQLRETFTRLKANRDAARREAYREAAEAIRERCIMKRRSRQCIPGEAIVCSICMLADDLHRRATTVQRGETGAD